MQPTRQRRDRDASVVERREELGVAASALAQQVVGRDPGVGERQRVGVGDVPAELVVGRPRPRSPGVPDGSDDRRDLGAAVLAGAGARRDRDERGDLAAGVGDELLRPVDDPLVAVEDGLGRRWRRRRSRRPARSGRSPRARDRPRGRAASAPSARAVPYVEDRRDAQADAGLERDADRLVDPAELLDRDAQAGEVAAGRRRTPREPSGRTGRGRPSRGRRRPGSGGPCPTAATCGAIRSAGELADAAAEGLVLA